MHSSHQSNLSNQHSSKFHSALPSGFLYPSLNSNNNNHIGAGENTSLSGFNSRLKSHLISDAYNNNTGKPSAFMHPSQSSRSLNPVLNLPPSLLMTDSYNSRSSTFEQLNTKLPPSTLSSSSLPSFSSPTRGSSSLTSHISQCLPNCNKSRIPDRFSNSNNKDFLEKSTPQELWNNNNNNINNNSNNDNGLNHFYPNWSQYSSAFKLSSSSSSSVVASASCVNPPPTADETIASISSKLNPFDLMNASHGRLSQLSTVNKSDSGDTIERFKPPSTSSLRPNQFGVESSLTTFNDGDSSKNTTTTTTMSTTSSCGSTYTNSDVLWTSTKYSPENNAKHPLFSCSNFMSTSNGVETSTSVTDTAAVTKSSSYSSLSLCTEPINNMKSIINSHSVELSKATHETGIDTNSVDEPPNKRICCASSTDDNKNSEDDNDNNVIQTSSSKSCLAFTCTNISNSSSNSMNNNNNGNLASFHCHKSSNMDNKTTDISTKTTTASVNTTPASAMVTTASSTTTTTTTTANRESVRFGVADFMGINDKDDGDADDDDEDPLVIVVDNDDGNHNKNTHDHDILTT
ncbi:unnamed protein product [Trichobilharzia regenti]|nr:unnamed protein product [Trichobilharzia regenti]